MRKRFAGALVVVATMLVFAPMSATAVGPGGPPNPLQSAIDSSLSGAVIDVPAGVYTGPIDFKGKDITLRSVGGPDSAILDANRSQGVQIGPGGRIEGFTIRNAVGGFGAAVVAIGSGSVIAHNRIESNDQLAGGWGAGVGGNGASPLIIDNEFRHNTCDSQWPAGVVSFVNSSSPRIVNNLFADNTCRAVNVTLPVGSTSEVVNNTFVNNSVAIRVDARGETDQHIYRNNVLVGNGIGLQVEALGPTFDHNLTWDNGANYSGIADQTGTNGNVSADPGFVSMATKNYRVRDDSPAVDAGASALAPDDDLDGTVRPLDANADGVASVDMGAYEARPDGRFHSLAPARILDTRVGNGAPPTRLGGGDRLDLQVSGRGGVPASGVFAVAVNITAVAPSEASHVTVWPVGNTMPATSNLNLYPGRTAANAAEIGLGPSGRVSLFNNAGTVDLVLDVVGWYDGGSGGGGRFTPVAPARLMDSRIGIGGPQARLQPEETRSLDVLGQNGVPDDSVTAVVVNVTAVLPTQDTFITVWPKGQARPLASSLNPAVGEVTANLVVAGVGADGSIALFNNVGSVDLVVDIVGWFDNGSVQVDGGYVPIQPSRVVDTRIGLGTPKVRLGPHSATNFSVTSTPGVSAVGVRAVVVNITTVTPSSDSYLTVWPSGQPRPATSNMNPALGRTSANLGIVQVGNDGKISIYNDRGSVDLIIDILGWYTAPLP